MIIKKLAGIILSIIIPSTALADTAYNFSFHKIDGSEYKLSALEGKVLLVVNTASNCGFTSQYEQLEQLWHIYKAKGLVIIAVPSNDFGGQEPGSNDKIIHFCETKFHTTFPIVNKEHVVGDDAHPFYKWAAEQTGYLGVPKWNFHKYLIGPNGEFVDYFFSTTSPTSAAITSKIDHLLE